VHQSKAIEQKGCRGGSSIASLKMVRLSARQLWKKLKAVGSIALEKVKAVGWTAIGR
jgi:hypothetical protein